MMRVVLLSTFLAGSLTADSNPEIFQQKLAPILKANCASCHEGAQAQANLRVDSLEALLKGGKRGAAITPGTSDTSLILQFVRGGQQPRMPLGKQLPESTIIEIAAAINEMKPLAASAPVRDEHLDWLLKPPAAVTIPEVKDKSFVASPIDSFIVSRLEAKGMHPAPAADKRVLLRRVYFDLLGVPPTIDEAKSFLDDQRPDAWERLVDKLLDDSRYGVRWARHWLDLARYAESDGFAVDTERPAAWRYRDYVIRSFNNDKPYDQFVKEQIAGDELKGGEEQDRSERLVALGFLRMATWEIDATSKQQLRQDFLNEVTGTTASVFLGLTAGCAQCHNHKYDPIPQRDFYRLQAFFAPMGIDEIPAAFVDAEKPSEMTRLSRQYEDEAETARKEMKQREEALKQRFIEMKGLKAGDDAVKDFMKELRVANVFFQEREDPIFKEQVWRDYLTAKDRVQELTELQRRYRPVAYSVRDVVPPNVPELPGTFVLQSGDLAAKGEKVEPGFLECVSGSAEPATIPFSGIGSGRRLALAEWIADEKNPLTSRVMVNRIWENHFGYGLVRTSSDFGKNGAPPTHPELLDWLAKQFVEHKWSIKAMHRLMLTSKTYRMSVENPESKKYAEIDPDNELLWRRNWMRHDAEVLRDSLLSVSGLLNPGEGGPGVLLDAPADVAEGFEFFKWFPSPEAEQKRRSIFTFQRRSVVNPMLETFDVANMNASCSRRNTTTVAPQALTLTNGALANKAARSLAQRAVNSAGPDAGKQIKQAFWLALSRDPSQNELHQAQGILKSFPGSEGLRHLGLVLFNTNEFQYQE